MICEQVLDLFPLYHLSSRMTLHALKNHTIRIQSQIRQHHNIRTSVLKAYINLKLFILIHVPFMLIGDIKIGVSSFNFSKQIYFHCLYKSTSELYELHQHYTGIHFLSLTRT